MHVENNPDFKTVWQLAHNWVNADPDKTNPNEISPELRIAILRLMRAIANQEITARQNGWKILTDDSFFSQLRDFLNMNNLKLIQCLRNDKFNKAYLDGIYVMRNEVVNWCNDVMRLPIPPCWALSEQQSAETLNLDEENKNWHDEMTDRRRKITGCLELARKLWEENPNLSYDQIYSHPVMRQYGNPSVFTKDSFQDWAKVYASEFAKKGGRRKKSMK
jgi:hypothetical protein